LAAERLQRTFGQIGIKIVAEYKRLLPAVRTPRPYPHLRCGLRCPGDSMIRIELGKEVSPGIFEYSVRSLGLIGKSRQPLLDACRQIKRALGSTKAAQARAGLYRPGRTTPDLHCVVLIGAGLSVTEPSNGRIHFAKFQEFSRSATLPDRFDAGEIEQEVHR
jgi:hypothetical protein